MWHNRSMKLIDRYRKALRQQAARHTRKLVKRAGDVESLELEVWGRERQDAYLEVGWHPISESFDGDKSGLNWSEMKMKLDL